MVSAAQLAKKIDLSPQRAAELVRTGLFQADADGRLNEDACIIQYVRFLRDEGRKSTASAAASRHADAKAREVELRIAKETRKVIAADEVCDFLIETVGTFRSRLSGVPAACTRDPELRATIETQLDDVIADLNRDFTGAAAAIEAGRPFSEEDQDDGNG